MVVFELHNAKKYCLGSGVGPQNAHSSAHHTPEKVFLDTWEEGVCNGQGQQNIVWVLEWRPKTHTTLQPIRQKVYFWIPGMKVFAMDSAKQYCLGSGVASQTPIPL